MASVGKPFKHFFVLIHFFEEEKYSVVKLKDVVTTTSAHLFQCNDDLDNWRWECSDIVDVPWNKDIYPAFFLQFGENRKEMEDLADDLHAGKILKCDIPLFQVQEPFASGSRQKVKEENVQENKYGSSKSVDVAGSSSVKLLKKRKSCVQKNLLRGIRKKMATIPCMSCKNFQNRISDLNKKINSSNKELEELQIKLSSYKEKTRRYRKKNKELKLSFGACTSADVAEPLEELIRLGKYTMISKSKLSLCRVSDYSKYVGDILDVLFGTKTLGNSVLKGIKGAAKVDVLDANIVSDLQEHVAEKFNISTQSIRAAIRQKLNVAHKIVKKNTSVN